MKTNGFIRPILLAGVMTVTAGCVERRVYVPVYTTQPQPVPGQTVVVQTPPPAAQVEVIPAAPGPGYVWMPGYWTWRGSWVWVGGAYVVQPKPHVVWVRGHWAPSRGGYVWVNGYWR